LDRRGEEVRVALALGISLASWLLARKLAGRSEAL
jgi:hypothetical protein